MKEKIKMIGFGAQVMLKQYERGGRKNGAFKIYTLCSSKLHYHLDSELEESKDGKKLFYLS